MLDDNTRAQEGGGDSRRFVTPSKEAWAAAQREMQELEREQGRRVQQQAERWVRVFQVFHGDETYEKTAAAEAIVRAKQALTSAGIAFRSYSETRDTERLVPDPEPPGGFKIELGSATTLALDVAAVDEVAALHEIRKQTLT